MKPEKTKSSLSPGALLVLHVAVSGILWFSAAAVSGFRWLAWTGPFMWEGRWAKGLFVFETARDLFSLPPEWIPRTLETLMTPDTGDRLVFLGSVFSVASLLALISGVAGGILGLAATRMSPRRVPEVPLCLGFQSAAFLFALFHFWDEKNYHLLADRAAALFGLFLFLFLAASFTRIGQAFESRAGGLKKPGSLLRFAGLLIFLLVVFFSAGSSFFLKGRAASSSLDEPSGKLSGERPRVRKVLLITIDTLRWDHTSLADYKRDTTPALAALAQEGVTFVNCIAPASWTLPSMMSLYTGRGPLAHGVEIDGRRLSPAIPTLAEALSKRGYHTAAFFTHIYVSSLYGFDRGYQDYEEFNITENFKHGIQPRAGEVNQKVFAWLDKNYDRDFLLSVHYFDPHWSYDPPPPYDTMFDPDYQGHIPADFQTLQKFMGPRREMNPKDREHLIALYDGEIRYTDHELSRLFDKLRSLGIYDELLIVVTADHGEEFEEHHGFSHSRTLYQEVLHVPLVIKFPRGYPAPAAPGTRISRPVTNLDLFPFLLELTAASPPPGLEGKPLFPETGDNPGEERPIFSRTIRHGLDKVSVLAGRFKFIHTYRPGWRKQELYDLAQDPGEQRNLAEEAPRQVEKMRRLLFDWVKKERRQAAGIPPSEPVKLDKRTRERLKSIGYF